jgi:thiol-disulfide isomerase/thioredoxin
MGLEEMKSGLIDRRATVLGLTGLTVSAAYAGDKPASPIAHGVLAENSLAQAFEPSPESELPYINIWGPQGTRSISELKGRTIVMPLWAEWCAPCLSELPDFARLQRKYGNDKFAIIPVLTATQKKVTPQLLAGLMHALHGDVFEPLIENNLGDRLMRKMARHAGGSAALPCNLIIAPNGRVVAREIGRIGNSDDTDPAKTQKEVYSRIDADAVQSRWGQADGDAFAAALANGFLA